MSHLPVTYRECLPLYRMLAMPRFEVVPAGFSAIVIETRRGFTPAEVDEMELWVIAELLVDGRGGEDDEGLLTPEEFQERAAADLVRRVQEAAAQGQASE